jgi:prolipoprotein diacylglyceryltransferase
MSSETPMQLGKDELYAPSVDQFLEEREALRREVPEAPKQPFLLRLIYSAWFYLAVAGALGALIAWALLEPHFKEGIEAEEETSLDMVIMYLVFPLVAAGIGLMLGAVEGLVIRNPMRAFICGLVGLGVGFGGGLISIFLAGIIFGIMSTIALRMSPNLQPDEIPHGMAFLVLMIGREVLPI